MRAISATFPIWWEAIYEEYSMYIRAECYVLKVKNFYPEHFFRFFYANRLTFPTKPPRMFYSELFNMKQSSIEQLLIEQSLFKQFYNEQMGTAANVKGGK